MTQQRRLTSLAKRWASLTLSANIITSSSCVGKAGSFFPIRLSILWKSSTSYLKGKKKKKKKAVHWSAFQVRDALAICSRKKSKKEK